MENNPRKLRPPVISIDDVINAYSRKAPKVTCVQVGANDGVFDDPIHKYVIRDKWFAILVEPQKDVFSKRLTKTYDGVDHVRLENVAIGQSQGTHSIYKIGFTDEKWALGLTSFNRQTIVNHIESGYVDRMAQKSGIKLPQSRDEYIVEEPVIVVPPSDLLKKHSMDKVSVISVDTEGFDYEILKSFDLEKLRPEVILYESKHLSKEDFVASMNLLRGLGYKLFWEKGNTLALSPTALSFLSGLELAFFRFRGWFRKL